MIDMAAKMQAIEDAIAAASGLACAWENEPQKMQRRNTPHILLGIERMQAHGLDDEVQEFDPGLEEMRVHTVGVRSFDLILRFRSYSQKPAENAIFYAEQTRSMLQHRRIIDILAARSISTLSAAIIGEASFEETGRMISQCNLTVTMHMAVVVRDGSAASDYMESVEGTIIATADDGTEIEVLVEAP